MGALEVYFFTQLVQSGYVYNIHVLALRSCKHKIRLLCDRNGVGVGYGEIITSLQSRTKIVKNFEVSYPQNAYPADWVPLWLLYSPHPGQSCLVEVRNSQPRNSTLFPGGTGDGVFGC